MAGRVLTLKSMFKRYRRPGDIVFAWMFFAFSLFLLFQLDSQTTWKEGGKLFAQAPFWPSIAVWLMTAFSALHLVGSLCSERIPGRWREVSFWVRSLEFAAWFMVYVFAVPYAGYLVTTLIFAPLLGYREGYRDAKSLALIVLAAFAIVLVFKAFLQVKIPAGALYELLPQAMRAFMITYF